MTSELLASLTGVTAPASVQRSTPRAVARWRPGSAVDIAIFFGSPTSLTLTASAVLGAVALSLISPVRAGHLSVRDVALAASRWLLALHLHGLYRRPASRLRPSGWWRPAVIARCLPTAALLALAADALILRGGRMTLTAAVAMTLPAIALVPFGASTDRPDVRPDSDPHSRHRNGTDLGSTDVEAAAGAPTPSWSGMSTTTRHPAPLSSADSPILPDVCATHGDRPRHRRLPECHATRIVSKRCGSCRARCRYRRSRATSSCTTGAPRPRSCTGSL